MRGRTHKSQAGGKTNWRYSLTVPLCSSHTPHTAWQRENDDYVSLSHSPNWMKLMSKHKFCTSKRVRSHQNSSVGTWTHNQLENAVIYHHGKSTAVREEEKLRRFLFLVPSELIIEKVNHSNMRRGECENWRRVEIVTRTQTHSDMLNKNPTFIYAFLNEIFIFYGNFHSLAIMSLWVHVTWDAARWIALNRKVQKSINYIFLTFFSVVNPTEADYERVVRTRKKDERVVASSSFFSPNLNPLSFHLENMRTLYQL